jgi:hypothetical protein
MNRKKSFLFLGIFSLVVFSFALFVNGKTEWTQALAYGRLWSM